MKIYTKTGDKGSTALVSGERVSKACLRIEAYGTLDELTAHLGFLHDTLPPSEPFALYRDQLLEIISRVMDCAALFATTDLSLAKLPSIDPSHVESLEMWTDQLLDELPILRHFTLPVGSPVISYTHICRTVARRAERACVRVSQSEITHDRSLQYVNRLSDYLYALSRRMSYIFSQKEILWR